MILVTFDPGQTTGYAIFDSGKLVKYGEMYEWERVEELVSQADSVLYERITVPGRAFNTIGIQVIGVIRLFCQRFKKTVVERAPSNMKPGRAWFPVIDCIPSPHSSDAVAHGVTYLEGKCDLTLLETLCRPSSFTAPSAGKK